MKINCLIATCLCVIAGYMFQSSLHTNKKNESCIATNVDYLEKRGLMFAPADGCFKSLLIANFSVSVSGSERNDIHYVVHHLGEASRKNTAAEKGYLLKHTPQLMSAGNRIEHVPVLQFLAVIFADHRLKADMNAIHKKGHEPWEKMKSNVARKFSNEHPQGTIMPQLEGFCAHVGADYNHMKGFIERGDWHGFLRALL